MRSVNDRVAALFTLALARGSTASGLVSRNRTKRNTANRGMGLVVDGGIELPNGGLSNSPGIGWAESGAG